MISSDTTMRAVTCDPDEARKLATIFEGVAVDVPRLADFARCHADALLWQAARREAQMARTKLPLVEVIPCQLLVGEELWSEVEVRLGTRTRSLAQEVEHLRGLLRQVWGAVPGREVAGLGDAIEQALAIQQPKSDT